MLSELLSADEKKSKRSEILKKLIKQMAMQDSDEDEEEMVEGEEPSEDESEMEGEEQLASDSGDEGEEMGEEEEGAGGLSMDEIKEMLGSKNRVPKKEGVVAISMSAKKMSPKMKGRKKGSFSKY